MFGSLISILAFFAAFFVAFFVTERIRKNKLRAQTLRCGVHPPLYVHHDSDGCRCVRCGQTWGHNDPAPPVCELSSLWRVEKRA